MNKLNIKFLQLPDRKLTVLSNDLSNIVVRLDEYTYEEYFTEFVKLIINKNDYVMDVGANLGYHTITLSELVGNDGKVYSFEPQRIIYQQLNSNIFSNGLDNVYSYNNAVGEDERYVNIVEPDYHFNQNIINTGNTGINHKNAGKNVKQITIDSLQLPKLNFIKLDIQGSELSALKGASNTISKFRPYMYIEIEESQLINFNINKNDLINYIKEIGYNLYKIHVNYNNLKGPTDDHICLPIEKNNFNFDLYKFKVEQI